SSCNPLSLVTSRTKTESSADLPILPRPGCCLFANHQYRRTPKEVLPHKVSAFSCRSEGNLIDSQARPPSVRAFVYCIPVDWLLNRKSRLKWQCEAVAHRLFIFASIS